MQRLWDADGVGGQGTAGRGGEGGGIGEALQCHLGGGGRPVRPCSGANDVLCHRQLYSVLLFVKWCL
jgi:hypothetical protein